MGNLVAPNGKNFDEPTSENEQKEEKSLDVKIITTLAQVTVDVKELRSAAKEHRRQSGVMVRDKDLLPGIQKAVADFVNWFAIAYPKLKHTLDTTLKDVGYTIGEVPEGVEQFNKDLRKESGGQ